MSKDFRLYRCFSIPDGRGGVIHIRAHHIPKAKILLAMQQLYDAARKKKMV